jgi:hypothetical protein
LSVGQEVRNTVCNNTFPWSIYVKQSFNTPASQNTASKYPNL